MQQDLTEQEAEQLLRTENKRYREGDPSMGDQSYDAYMKLYAEKFPNNAWFNELTVEPDAVTGKTVTLPERMLSTNKAYSVKEIEKWANDVIEAGRKLDIYEIFFKVTPKLDGFAAYDDGKTLYTRGDGRSGTDITRAIANGLAVGTRGLGPGEIVVDKHYFKYHLSPYYDNSRNIIAGVIKEGEIDPAIKLAMEEGAIDFQPFAGRGIERQTMTKDILLFGIDTLFDVMQRNCIYDTDGIVIEVMDERIKAAMGATNHHHRWQIAYKKNTEYHDIRVTGLVWQTSKNGRLTPVVQLEPTKVSGVMISKATGHNFGNVQESGIDTGAIVKVCRSGLVIPYISEVVKTCAGHVSAPLSCPSCGEDTAVEGDNLFCTNTFDCPAQIEGTIEFFFKTLGNCDGFGPKVIEQLCSRGMSSITAMYHLSHSDFKNIIGGKNATNLFEELYNSRQRPIEDWRFLAAFSIHNVGKGGCERLLKHHRLPDIWSLTADEVMAIDGFAQKTAESLVKSLRNIKPMFDVMMGFGFSLIETPLVSEISVSGPIAGKTIVFTGSMQQGKRDDMEKHAKSLGAKVGSSVSSKTDYLICGANVGAAKTAAAEKNGVTVLTEDDYLQMVA
jgi:DNA ligase (NAD+)